MLSIAYHEQFKGNDRCLLITGDSDSYQTAASYFDGKGDVPLINDTVFAYTLPTFEVTQGSLLTVEECRILAQNFREIAQYQKPAHIYFDIEALEDITVIISCGEYNSM